MPAEALKVLPGGRFGRPVPKEKRAAILEDAAAVFALLPGASMAELAEGLGISRATLYRYFPKREQLVHALALEAVRLIDEASNQLKLLQNSYLEAFGELIELLVPIGDRYHFFVTEPRCIRHEDVKKEVERQYQQLFEMIDQAKAHGEINPQLPTAWVAACFDSAVWSAWWTVTQGSVAPNDAQRLAVESFRRSVQLHE